MESGFFFALLNTENDKIFKKDLRLLPKINYPNLQKIPAKNYIHVTSYTKIQVVTVNLKLVVPKPIQCYWSSKKLESGGS